MLERNRHANSVEVALAFHASLQAQQLVPGQLVVTAAPLDDGHTRRAGQAQVHDTSGWACLAEVAEGGGRRGGVGKVRGVARHGALAAPSLRGGALPLGGRAVRGPLGGRALVAGAAGGRRRGLRWLEAFTHCAPVVLRRRRHRLCHGKDVARIRGVPRRLQRRPPACGLASARGGEARLLGGTGASLGVRRRSRRCGRQRPRALARHLLPGAFPRRGVHEEADRDDAQGRRQALPERRVRARARGAPRRGRRPGARGAARQGRAAVAQAFAEAPRRRQDPEPGKPRGSLGGARRRGAGLGVAAPGAPRGRRALLLGRREARGRCPRARVAGAAAPRSLRAGPGARSAPF
mmetsp:Transcript_133605/g.415489  ORF Transcript_133605/g.415489 Transcript_133605/m.415489 type:complete len:350 (+) Transcript_133605:164-1213(+)